jgi:hypothetical protein
LRKRTSLAICVKPELILLVQWDDHLVRVSHRDELAIVHVRVPAGHYARILGPAPAEPTTRQQAYIAQLLGRCERVGTPLHQWAEAALADRSVRAIRLILHNRIGVTRNRLVTAPTMREWTSRTAMS